jgi:hypothetical protein
MTNEERLALLAQKARDLSIAEENLRRYEQAVAREPGRINHEVHGELKCEVWAAQAALRRLQAAGAGEGLAKVTAEDVRRVCRQAQEQAIASLARTQGWQWEEAHQRWRTPEGDTYSPTGEPL